MTTVKITRCFQEATDKKFGTCFRYCDWPGNRIIESLRLEKTSKIVKSNHQPITPMPAKPRREVPCLHVS